VAITEMARRVKNWGITKQLNAFPHFGCSDHRLEKTEQRFYTRAKAVVDLSGTFMHKSSQVPATRCVLCMHVHVYLVFSVIFYIPTL
jgi:hypothetical protein